MISVIIPAYNVADKISKMFQCLNRQTENDLEIIVVDDGSIDDLDKLCKKTIINSNMINYSNFAHVFCLCTLKIQYLAVIQLSKFRCYAA